jgi:hypothetical protein
MIHYTRRSISPPRIERAVPFIYLPPICVELSVDGCRNVAVVPVRAICSSAASITTS